MADALPRPSGQPVDPTAVVTAILAKPAFTLPQGRNVYAPTTCAYLAAEGPTRDGEVALKGGFTQDREGHSHPAVQIRAQVRKAGQADLITKVVTMD